MDTRLTAGAPNYHRHGVNKENCPSYDHLFGGRRSLEAAVQIVFNETFDGESVSALQEPPVFRKLLGLSQMAVL